MDSRSYTSCPGTAKATLEATADKRASFAVRRGRETKKRFEEMIQNLAAQRRPREAEQSKAAVE
jgi:hypothetical protein